MRTLVIGARGQLGSEVTRLARLRGHVVEAGSGFKALERIEDPFADFFKDNVFDLIVNCAAYHDVVQCEEDPERALEVNAFAQMRLVAAVPPETKVVYVSTNYVFSGCRVKESNDSPNPGTVYGYSKALGEYFTLRGAANYVARMSFLYGHVNPRSKGPNLVRRIANACKDDEVKTLRYADDKPLTLTNATDAARMIFEMLKYMPGRAYNCCSIGTVNASELVLKIATLKGCEKERVSYKEKAVGSPLVSFSSFENVNRPALVAVEDFLREAGEI